ncbi:MAG TPA: GDP-mannose 4,6-dehydratase [Oculatellaceae cyanobacterium]
MLALHGLTNTQGVNVANEKRVLITGITGMAGSHLAEFILKEHPDHKIYATKRWRSPLNNIVDIESQVHLFDCDLTDPTGVRTLIEDVKPHFIFHLAAQSFVPTSWTNPISTLTDNISMQLNIFEAVRHTKIDPVIQIALSSEEYGLVLPDEVPISETNPLRPLSPYAVSKVGQDMLGYQYCQSYGLKVIRTRAFNHEGPRRGEVFVTSNFAKQIAEIEAGLRLPVIHHGNLDAKRDWTDVRDMVRAYWMSVHKCTPGEDYVIASGVTRTIRSMLDYLLSLSTCKIECKLDESRLRPSDVQVLWGEPAKFKKVTGWEQTITFEQTMQDLLDYWRKETAVKKHTSAAALAGSSK